MNPTADRYAVVLWALREHHRVTRAWYATAPELALIVPHPGGHTDATRSVSRTLIGMANHGLIHSTRRSGLETRAWRLEHEPHRAPFGAERWIHQPAQYSTTQLGDLVNDMLDLVGTRTPQAAIA